MKVAFFPGFGAHPKAGGVGSFARHMIESLLQLGHAVVIAGRHDWARAYQPRGAELLEQPSPWALRSADVVHLNIPYPRGLALALLSGPPVVATHQDHGYVCPAITAWTPLGCEAGERSGPCRYCPRQGLRWVARTRALRWLAAKCWNVAVSRALLESLRLPNGTWILNAIDPQPAPGPGTPGLLAFAGRLVPEKGLDLLLRAMARVPGARLEVAGDGAFRAIYERQAESLGIAQRVRFLGWVSQGGIRELYQRAVAVCVPSVWPEPCPYTATEAMAMGRPVLACNTGGLPELLGDGRGWVCPPTEGAWASAIDEALGSSAARERRSALALQFVEKELHPLRIARRYTELYERALG